MRAARSRVLLVGSFLAGFLIVATATHAQIGGVDVPLDPNDPFVQNEISLTLVPGTVAGQPQVLKEGCHKGGRVARAVTGCPGSLRRWLGGVLQEEVCLCFTDDLEA